MNITKAKEVGGKIHKILNETTVRKLTMKEYMKLIPLIEELRSLAHQSGREEMKQECIKAVPEKKVFDSMDTTLLKTRGEVRAWNSCREQMLGNLKKYEKEA